MKTLVIGGGGREHCIVKALLRSGAEIFAVSGNKNPGIFRVAKDFLLHDVMDVDGIISWAKPKSIDLAIIGPEAPLGAGVVDRLAAIGVDSFGPTRAAAQIELSKEFARDLMKKFNVPGLIDYRAFDNTRDFKEWLHSNDIEFVMKPIGLTGGKGVRVWGDHFNSKSEALAYAEEILENRIGGSSRFLVEEKAVGEEFSLQAFSDGKGVIPMPLAQDHKRAYEGDKGPNTGGMGSYSDANHLLPFVKQTEFKDALEIMKKIVEAMAMNGTPFRGCLYGGFICTRSGPKVLEFNARFADPESMNVLPILEGDFVDVCRGAATGRLPRNVRFKSLATVCKYVVPEGYGTKPLSGQPIDVDEKAISEEGAELFWASVDEKNAKTYTSNSRSLAVVGMNESLERAEQVAEAGLRHIKGRIHMRHDIGKREIVLGKIQRMDSIRKASRRE